MKAEIIAHTKFLGSAAHPEWTTDAFSDVEALIEFAGRACYQSWNKPNAATSTNHAYINHIIDVGHLSVLEHGVVTFYFTGVSRSLTHELIRHRHFSYSQLSQRYVPFDRTGDAVMPDIIASDYVTQMIFENAMTDAQSAYERLVDRLSKVVGIKSTLDKKRVRQAARAVLPNAAETKIVVTGNMRQWRHFIELRGSKHADEEIRELARTVLLHLANRFPAVFNDFYCPPDSDVPNEVVKILPDEARELYTSDNPAESDVTVVEQ